MMKINDNMISSIFVLPVMLLVTTTVVIVIVIAQPDKTGEVVYTVNQLHSVCGHDNTQYKHHNKGVYCGFDTICEAEQAGIDPTNCVSHSGRRYYDRRCPIGILLPVFCTTTTKTAAAAARRYNHRFLQGQHAFANRCVAEQARGFDPRNCGATEQFVECAQQQGPDDTSTHTVLCSSAVTRRHKHRFENRCFAEKAGFDAHTNCYDDYTHCTNNFDYPLICGGKVFPNLCFAQAAQAAASAASAASAAVAHGTLDYTESNCIPYDFEEIVCVMTRWTVSTSDDNENSIVVWAYVCDYEQQYPPTNTNRRRRTLPSNFHCPPIPFVKPPVVTDVVVDDSTNKRVTPFTLTTTFRVPGRRQEHIIVIYRSFESALAKARVDPTILEEGIFLL